MLHPQAVPIQRLIPAPWNPRDVEGERFADLCQSLRDDLDFLWLRPILAQLNGTVYAGNLRLRAAIAIGLETVPAILEDVSDQLAKQRAVRDNAQWGRWLEPELASLLRELDADGADLTHLGIEAETLASLLQESEESGLESDLDAVGAPPVTPRTQPGDLVRCGPHAVLCADSTDQVDVTRLLDGRQADALLTDASYGVAYEGGTADRLTIANDGPAGLSRLLYEAFRAADAVLAPGAPIYLFHPAGPLVLTFLNAFLAQGWDLRQTLVWVKNAFVLGHSDYHYQHEPILYGYKPGAGRRGRGASGWHGGNDASSVLDVARPQSSPDHPTPKPVELLRQLISNSTQAGALVFDPFLGSGSTLIAAEETGRICYGIEIEPRYVDVAVQRWEQATGGSATRESASDGEISATNQEE